MQDLIMDEGSRRALFSAMAMQGLLASRLEHADPVELAGWARSYADALIAELAREQVAGGQ